MILLCYWRQFQPTLIPSHLHIVLIRMFIRATNWCRSVCARFRPDETSVYIIHEFSFSVMRLV